MIRRFPGMSPLASSADEAVERRGPLGQMAIRQELLPDALARVRTETRRLGLVVEQSRDRARVRAEINRVGQKAPGFAIDDLVANTPDRAAHDGARFPHRLRDGQTEP